MSSKLRMTKRQARKHALWLVAGWGNQLDTGALDMPDEWMEERGLVEREVLRICASLDRHAERFDSAEEARDGE